MVARSTLSNCGTWVSARAQLKTDRKSVNGGETSIQSGTLQITLNGSPVTPETRTGIWTAYGRDLASKNVSAVQTGTFTIAFPGAGQPQILPPVLFSTSSTPEHILIKGKPLNSGKKMPKIEKVEAVGSKYIGYSVVVKAGDRVVGETYEPPSLKKEAK